VRGGESRRAYKRRTRGDAGTTKTTEGGRIKQTPARENINHWTKIHEENRATGEEGANSTVQKTVTSSGNTRLKERKKVQIYQADAG